MQTVIYADILFFINFIITFVLLNLTSDFSGNDAHPKRIIPGSIVGGVYSFIILAPTMNALLLILLKVIMLLSIVLISFKTVTLKKFISCTMTLLLVSFVFSGIMYSLSVSMLKNRIHVNNGYFYLDIGPIKMIFVITLFFVIIKILKRTVFTRKKSDFIYNLFIRSSNEQIMIKALYDSGNFVTDPFTGNPVIIVNISEGIRLVDAEVYYRLKDILNNAEFDCIPEGVRLIPITALGHSQLIPAITVDCVIVDFDTGQINLQKPTVAFTDNSFDNKLYSALINESVLRGEINGLA